MHSALRQALRSGGSALLAAAGLSLCAAPVEAQHTPPAHFLADWHHDTGLVRNDTAERSVVASFTVYVEGADSIQLRFDDVQLAGDVFAGTGSILRITSHLDGAVQELNRYHVQQWRKQTAYFNGNTVQVDIVASPGTGPNRARLAQVFAFETPFVQESQCGPTDDRVASNDPRACRILPVGCTGWLINDCNQCMLTAGHCNGGLGTAQFNVPLSNPNGSLNQPSPDDQYPIDASSIQGTGSGIGNDWGYYGAFPNSNTDLTPAEAQGATYEIEIPPPLPSGQSIRITGYGVDGGTANQTQQTHVGDWILFSGTRLSYTADTQGGNSGSAVLWEDTGKAIGIHTHAGCNPPSAGNNGTSLSLGAIQNALANPQGLCQASIRLLSDLPERIPSGSSTTIDVAIAGTVQPGTAMLNVRFDGGTYIEVPLVHGGGTLYQATLPPPVCGSAPEFYFSANLGNCGGPVTLPQAAPGEVFTTEVSDTTPFLVSDMEADQGWTVDLVNSTATTGLWERGDPIGTVHQPEDDHTPDPGSECWFTGQGSNVGGGRTLLVSPLMDMTTMSNPHIGYWRWYSNGTAAADDRLRIQISTDDGANWVLAEAVGPLPPQTSGGWFRHSFRVADIVTPTSQMRLRVNASDVGSNSPVEAAFDDFELFEVDCSSLLEDCNANGIVDSDDIASGRSSDADLNGVPDECAVGTEYCYCPSGPCGNDSATSGCLHSGGFGPRIEASGSPSVSTDDLVITAYDLPANKPGIMYMGASQIQTPFGDGQQCVGAGGVGLFRFGFQNTGPSGTFVLGPGLSALSMQRFAPAGHITAGSTWNFQGWLRDPSGPCGTGFTTSTALSVTFAP